MDNIKFKVIYNNKTYDFEYGSQVFIFHTGIYRDMQKRSIKELLQYVNLVQNCYLKDSNKRNLQKRMLGTLACPTILFTAGLFTTSKKKV